MTTPTTIMNSRHHKPVNHCTNNINIQSLVPALLTNIRGYDSQLDIYIQLSVLHNTYVYAVHTIYNSTYT